ncbi:MAG: RMD1 family protein [Bacteroidales bacterium]|nr:RMD1 family protein [Bacteroidales bacterium]
MEIKAYQIADYINIKQFKNDYKGELHNYSSSDLFYINENNRYLYILSYGVVVFCGYDELKISENIEFMMNYVINPLNEKLTEEFFIHTNVESDKFGHNEVYISKISPEVIKIVSLNIGQSVALDYYQIQAAQLLDETNSYTKALEEKGRLRMRNTTLLKFIGKTLNVKNNIFDQLYVFDQPEAAWNDEYLSKIDTGLRQIFDIKTRFKSVDYTLQIVNDNLELFKDLMQHKQSNLLEIIIIVLIMVEVGNLFLEKFL